MTQRKIHRRRFLQLSGATTAAVVLAACGGPEPEVITEEPAAAAAEEEAPKQVVMEDAEAPSQYSESPRLAEMVANGDLPPSPNDCRSRPWYYPVKRSASTVASYARFIWIRPASSASTAGSPNVC